MTTEAELFDALKYRVVVNPGTGTRRYYNHAGRLHCEDGPAVEYANGTKEWWQNGLRHREDGPAAVWADHAKEWWQNGLRHREDGPAIEYPSGIREWWQNGKLHRTVGPAVEHPSGIREWWLDDVQYTEQAYHAQLKTLGHTP